MKSIKDYMIKFLIIIGELFAYIASLALLFVYIIFIRPGEYFLNDAVVSGLLIAMAILNIFLILKYKKRIRKASIIGAVICLTIVIGANEMICIQHTNFSSEKWKKNPSIRHFMIDDLIKTYLKENMTVTEVENLLGKYASRRYENEGDLEQTISYYYSYYGYHERLSNDLYLNIYFNSENKIVRWKFYEEPALWN